MIRLLHRNVETKNHLGLNSLKIYIMLKEKQNVDNFS